MDLNNVTITIEHTHVKLSESTLERQVSGGDANIEVVDH